MLCIKRQHWEQGTSGGQGTREGGRDKSGPYDGRLKSLFLFVEFPLFLDGIDQGMFAAIANHDIDAWKGCDCLRVEFRVTAGDDQQCIGMAAACLADKLAGTAVAQVRDRTSVDDVDIGGLAKVALHKASRTHLLANGFAIGLVYLAA